MPDTCEAADGRRRTDQVNFEVETQGEPAEVRRLKIHQKDGLTARPYLGGGDTFPLVPRRRLPRRPIQWLTFANIV